MSKVIKRLSPVSALRDDAGSVGHIFALMLIPFMMLIGVSVDFARGTSTNTDMQNALDAAAIAALKAGPNQAETVGTQVFAANYTNAATDMPVLNFKFVDGGGMKATARASLQTSFATIFGVETLEVSTESLIEPKRTTTETTTEQVTVSGNVPCIHVMDQSNQQAFDLQDNENLNASDCDARVRSNRTQAMLEDGGDNVQFKRIDVKGGASVSNGLSIISSPYHVNTDAAVVGNPYLDGIRDVVQAVSVGNCNNANTGKTWSGVIAPGTYCGTTEFKNATFAGGLYVIKSGSGNKSGALTLSGSLNGSAGVTFYFADNKSKLISYTGNSGTVLKAPTTGTTRGLLFFESSNRGASWNVTIENRTNHTWQGLVYLPSANLTFTGLETWPLFHVSVSANTLLVEQWQDITWTAYAWTPFNATTPITYDNEVVDQTVTSQNDKPLFIKQ